MRCWEEGVTGMEEQCEDRRVVWKLKSKARAEEQCANWRVIREQKMGDGQHLLQKCCLRTSHHFSVPTPLSLPRTVPLSQHHSPVPVPFPHSSCPRIISLPFTDSFPPFTTYHLLAFCVSFPHHTTTPFHLFL